MKKVRLFFAVTLLMLVACVQSSVAQNSMDNFLRANDEKGYKLISHFAHPTNIYQGGSCYVRGNDIYVTIYSKGRVNKKTYTLELRIHKSGVFFDELDVISDTDSWTFWASSGAKLLANKIVSNYASNDKGKIERWFGKLFCDMSAEDLCCACLSLMRGV